MKKLLLLFITAVVLSLFLSCSDDEKSGAENKRSEPLLEAAYKKSKDFTKTHNLMLDYHYHYLVNNGLEDRMSIINDEKKLDKYIEGFAESIEPLLTKNNATRSVQNHQITFSEIKQMALSNDALFKNPTIRSSNDSKKFEYLDLFCDEFYGIDELEMEELDAQIEFSLHKVLSSYPNLNEKEIELLFFVAGVTYNSCVYWNENLDKWIDIFSDNQSTRGAFGDAVKSGTKKWAYADSKGAVAAGTVSWIVTGAMGGMNLLAGAAVGSTIGAIENFFQ